MSVFDEAVSTGHRTFRGTAGPGWDVLSIRAADLEMVQVLVTDGRWQCDWQHGTWSG